MAESIFAISAATKNSRPVLASIAIVLAPRAVLIVAAGMNVCASFSKITLNVQSPFELKINLRIGSKAAPSLPPPIGTVAMLAPLSASTTTRILLAQVAQRRRASESNANPCGFLARGHVTMRFDFVAFSVDFYDVMIFSDVHKERTFAVGETSLQTGTDVYRRNRGVRFWIDDGE